MYKPIALIIFAYLLGSVPTGLWTVKLLKGIDIRQIGSGSTGTTNVLRTAGKTAAIFVFIVDIAKGFIPVWLSIKYSDFFLTSSCSISNNLFQAFPCAHLLPILCGGAALVGHSKSIFANFKGGKSAATGLGTLAAMNLSAGVCMLSVFALTVIISRIVSVASITAAITAPIFMYVFSGVISFTIYNLIGSTFVIFRHKDNIKRLFAGTEPRIGEKAQPKN
jgi:glycerol-3-phosphate acyltransferase PlsY